MYPLLRSETMYAILPYSVISTLEGRLKDHFTTSENRGMGSE